MDLGGEPADGRAFRWDIESGHFAEIDLDMSAESQVTAAFAAEGPDVQWDVHSHVDGMPVIHLGGMASSETVPFSPDEAGIYSFKWTNPGPSDVRLEVGLSADPDVIVHRVVPTPDGP